MPASLDRLASAVGERFRVPAMTSARAGLWIAGHRALSAPLVLVGTARLYRARLEGTDVRVLCVGREERFQPFLTQVLAGSAQLRETRRGRFLWSPGRLWPADADLVAVELHSWLAARFRAAGWLVCPEMVRWQGSVSRMPPTKPSKSLRSDLNRIARGGYTLEVTSGSAADWDEFERGMLIPYTRGRFGEEAWIPSAGLMRALKRRGLLHFVRKDGRRVAGACLVCHRDEAWTVLFGTKDGDLALMREGAQAAHYSLAIDWARGLGVRRIDYGPSSAFQLDGIARVKRKWGMSAVRDPLAPLIAIRADPTKPALRRVMERQPFLVLASDGALRAYPDYVAAP